MVGFPKVSLTAGPANVIDGDTIEVAGERIRLHGIDAPEDEHFTQVTETGIAVVVVTDYDAGDYPRDVANR